MEPERSWILEEQCMSPSAPSSCNARLGMMLATLALACLAYATRDASAALLFATPTTHTQLQDPLTAVYPVVKTLRGTSTIPLPSVPQPSAVQAVGEVPQKFSAPSIDGELTFHSVPAQGWWPMFVIVPLLVVIAKAILQVRALRLRQRRQRHLTPLNEVALPPLPFMVMAATSGEKDQSGPLSESQILHGRWALLGALGFFSADVMLWCNEALRQGVPVFYDPSTTSLLAHTWAKLLQVQALLSTTLGTMQPHALDWLAVPAFVSLVALAGQSQLQDATLCPTALAFAPGGNAPSLTPRGNKRSPRAGSRSQHVLQGLFGLGAPELAIIVVTAGFLFGPRSLGELAKSAGKMAGDLKEVPKQFQEGLQEGSVKDKKEEEGAAADKPAEPSAEKPKPKE